MPLTEIITQKATDFYRIQVSENNTKNMGLTKLKEAVAELTKQM